MNNTNIHSAKRLPNLTSVYSEQHSCAQQGGPTSPPTAGACSPLCTGPKGICSEPCYFKTCFLLPPWVPHLGTSHCVFPSGVHCAVCSPVFIYLYMCVCVYVFLLISEGEIQSSMMRGSFIGCHMGLKAGGHGNSSHVAGRTLLEAGDHGRGVAGAAVSQPGERSPGTHCPGKGRINTGWTEAVRTKK